MSDIYDQHRQRAEESGPVLDREPEGEPDTTVAQTGLRMADIYEAARRRPGDAPQLGHAAADAVEVGGAHASTRECKCGAAKDQLSFLDDDEDGAAASGSEGVHRDSHRLPPPEEDEHDRVAAWSVGARSNAPARRARALVRQTFCPAFVDYAHVRETAAWLREWLASDPELPAPFELRPGETVVDARTKVAASLRDLERCRELLDSGAPVARDRVEAMLRLRAQELGVLRAALAT